MEEKKKDAVWPGIRVPKEMLHRGKKAYKKLGIPASTFRRQLLADFIRIAEADEIPALPARILTTKEAEILRKGNSKYENTMH